MISFSALKDHLVTAIATSAILGGSVMVISTNNTVAQHEVRITRIETLDKSIADLSDDLRATREQLVAVEARGDTRRRLTEGN